MKIEYKFSRFPVAIKNWLSDDVSLIYGKDYYQVIKYMQCERGNECLHKEVRGTFLSKAAAQKYIRDLKRGRS